MISHEQVLAEMERQLQLARTARDERAVREALAAIRSLCEVVLGAAPSVRPARTELPKEQVQQPIITQPVSSTMPLEGRPLEEEDANGGSLFDF